MTKANYLIHLQGGGTIEAKTVYMNTPKGLHAGWLHVVEVDGWEYDLNWSKIAKVDHLKAQKTKA